jgi:hypothetical protein
MTPGRLYRFGRFRLDGDAHLLFRDDARQSCSQGMGA